MNAMFSVMSLFMILFVLAIATIFILVLVKATGGPNKSNRPQGTNNYSQDNDQQMFMNQMTYQNDINHTVGGFASINKDSDHDGFPDAVDPNPYSFDAPGDHNFDSTGTIDMNSSSGFDTNSIDTGSFDNGSFDNSSFDNTSFDSGSFDTGTFDSTN